MIDYATTTPSEQPRRKWRWWHFALAAVGMLILISMFGGSAPKLRVSFGKGGSGLIEVRIINADTKPITITKVVVNDRKDCAPRSILTLTEPDAPFPPQNLEIGEQALVYTGCRPVRVAITSTVGDATFEFR